jgi:succinate dehydrogenase / fumarate reductase cytochrome b subunit
VDFWSQGPRYQRQMSYAVIGLFLLTFLPFVWRHLSFVFGD